ncbi:hypothetical protein ACMA5I_12845 [Paracoccaceae bacterium GXU_MW_L88]
MSDRDSFVDEVTDELRRDKLMARLKGLSWVIGTVAVVAVGAVAWLEWDKSRGADAAAANGDRLANALTLQGAERAAALEDASDLVSQMARADALADAGETDQARAAYEALANEDPLYGDLARLKLALMSEGDLRTQLLDAMIGPDRPYRLLALEQRAIDAAAAGDFDAARADLSQITSAESVPAEMQQRVLELSRIWGLEEPAADAPMVVEPTETEGEAQ